MTESLSSSWVEVEPGVRLFVQDWGPRNGKPIVLVHGFPFSHRIFDYQAVVLAQQGFRVVSPDLRGFGQSDKPWHGNDYDTWAGDLRSVIATLDLQTVTLSGFSMGGAIAAHYAATQNDSRIAKLALLAAAAPLAAATEEQKQMLTGFVQAVQADQASFVHAFIQNAFHTLPSPETALFLDSMGTQGSLWAEICALEELRERNLVPGMGRITVPTRIFHGTQDRAVPFAAGEAQQQLISGASLVRFEQSGHCLMYEEKNKLAAELSSFHTE